MDQSSEWSFGIVSDIIDTILTVVLSGCLGSLSYSLGLYLSVCVLLTKNYSDVPVKLPPFLLEKLFIITLVTCRYTSFYLELDIERGTCFRLNSI